MPYGPVDVGLGFQSRTAYIPVCFSLFLFNLAIEFIRV